MSWDSILDEWGEPDDGVLPAVLARRVAERGDDPFLAIGDGSWVTYRQLQERAASVAGSLSSLGVAPGDHVALLAETSMMLVETWFATDLLGAVDVPLNPAAVGETLAHALRLSGAKVLVADAGLMGRVLAVADQVPSLHTVATIGETDHRGDGGQRVVALGDVAPAAVDLEACRPAYHQDSSVLLTSGTSGPAKGVRMAYAQTYAIAREIVHGLRMTKADVMWCCHPLFHMTRFGSVSAALVAGCRVVLDRRFEADVWLKRVRETGATVTIGHGPMLEMVQGTTERDDDVDNPLRAVLCAPLPAAIAEDFEQRFDVRGIEVWGMTEVTCVSWRPYDEPLRVGSCGKPLDELFEVQVVHPVTDQRLPPGAVGELVVRPKRSWITFQGYLGMAGRTVETWRNMWIHTGDTARFDEDGWLHFAERDSDRIRRRAENVSAYEIEVAVSNHETVAECAAVGVPSEYSSDDDIKVCVVPAPGATVDPTALTKYLVGRIPHHMVPRYIEVVSSLPRSATEKVRKDELRSRGTVDSWDRHEAGVSVRELSELHGSAT